MSEFSWPVRVYYEDTDAGGVVYNANYLKFMERARSEYLRSLGFEQDQLAGEGIIFAVHRTEIDFLQPARFNQLLEVTARIIEQKKVSLLFAQEIRQADATLFSRALVRVVCINPENFKPRAIPENIMRAIADEH